MHRCKTCKWWDIDYIDRRGELGRLVSKPCSNLKLNDWDERDTLDHEYDTDGEIFTGPDFGCIHHKNPLYVCLECGKKYDTATEFSSVWAWVCLRCERKE